MCDSVRQAQLQQAGEQDRGRGGQRGSAGSLELGGRLEPVQLKWVSHPHSNIGFECLTRAARRKFGFCMLGVRSAGTKMDVARLARAQRGDLFEVSMLDKHK